LVRLYEGSRQLPELAHIARLARGNRQDVAEVLSHTVSVVLAELCLDQVGQVGVDLDGRRRDAEKLAGQGRGARASKWIQACGDRATTLSDCPGNDFRRERLLEVMPLLEGKRFRPGVAADGDFLSLSSPRLERNASI